MHLRATPTELYRTARNRTPERIHRKFCKHYTTALRGRPWIRRYTTIIKIVESSRQFAPKASYKRGVQRTEVTGVNLQQNVDRACGTANKYSVQNCNQRRGGAKDALATDWKAADDELRTTYLRTRV